MKNKHLFTMFDGLLTAEKLETAMYAAELAAQIFKTYNPGDNRVQDALELIKKGRPEAATVIIANADVDISWMLPQAGQAASCIYHTSCHASNPYYEDDSRIALHKALKAGVDPSKLEDFMRHF